MRIYGSVPVIFWDNPDIQNLSDQAKLLAVYLLTCSHSNMIGCYRLPTGYIVEDLHWDQAQVNKLFQELIATKFLIREENSWLIIHEFLKWNPIQNPRQGVGVRKLFSTIPPQSTVAIGLTNSLLVYGKYLEKEFVDQLMQLQNSSATVFEECMRDQEQDKNQEQNQKTLISGIELHQVNSAKNSELKNEAIEIINFLNEKSGRNFRVADSNIKLIIARLRSGATKTDCFQIIAKKTRQWKDNPKMWEFLRPETLFRASKFESYIGELGVIVEGEKP